MNYVEVAIPLPVKDLFVYRLENGLAERARVGCRVRVPFKNREIQGYIVGFSEEGGRDAIKPVTELLDDTPLLNASLLELTRWMSEYYFCSWGEAIEVALPAPVKSGRRSIPKMETGISDKVLALPFDLNEEQEKAVEWMDQALERQSFSAALLHGVTGSGKTEVYIRAIQRALRMNRGAICLVPEIALTEQIEQFFQGHFGDLLEIIHSRLKSSERWVAWERIRRGAKRVVLGPRSALFAGVRDLGLIIMDEEHEGSYKQQESPRYHARTTAWKRAELEGAVFLMGTATPSLEVMQAVCEGRLAKLELRKRVVDRPLPDVRVIDLKRDAENRKKRMLFSVYLEKQVARALEKGEGVLLLLNRRGFATQVQCLACGKILVCKRCEVALTYHRDRKCLLCHYCNFEERSLEACPYCHAAALRYVGFGTEKIESEIARLFPRARVARLDSDVARKRGMHEKILKSFRQGKTDLLVGTQMIAKGFDFPQVTLVGIVSADTALALPDFRASERTFQLLCQMAGRAGRGEKAGEVIIQTFAPDHHSIRCTEHHDYERFFREEIAHRRELGYPPFNHLVNVMLRGKREKQVIEAALKLEEAVSRELRIPNSGERIPTSALGEGGDEHRVAGIQLMGPAPLPFYRLRGHFRWHLLLQGKDISELNQVLRRALEEFRKPSRVQMAVDVDPTQVL